MTYFDDGSIVVSLDIMWNTKRPDDLQINRETTIGGKDSSYKYGTIRNFMMPTRWVSTSDAQQINQWWLNSTPLYFFYGPEASSFDVVLTNNEHPYTQLEKGYQDHFAGVLVATVK